MPADPQISQALAQIADARAELKVARLLHDRDPACARERLAYARTFLRNALTALGEPQSPGKVVQMEKS